MVTKEKGAAVTTPNTNEDNDIVSYYPQTMDGFVKIINDMGIGFRQNSRTLAYEYTEDGETYLPLNENKRHAIASEIEDYYSVKKDKPYTMSETKLNGRICAFISLYDKEVDPVSEWLNNLPKWDGTPRIVDLFIKYLGVEDTELNRTAAQLIMKALVARSINPGVKFDYMPILMGEQGIAKSSLLRHLVPEQFRSFAFAENVNLAADDAQIFDRTHKVGAWMVEYSELAGIQRKEVEKIKSWLTTQFDPHRNPYSRDSGNFARKFIVVGTTNDTGNGILLDDPSGHRRFIIMKCKSPDNKYKHVSELLDFVDNNIEQLYAEAKHLYEQDSKLFLPIHLLQAQEAINADYEKRDMDLDAKIKVAAESIKRDEDRTAAAVAELAYKKQYVDLTESQKMATAKVLKRLGYTAKRKSHSRYWIKEPTYVQSNIIEE